MIPERLFTVEISTCHCSLIGKLYNDVTISELPQTEAGYMVLR